MNRDEAVDLLRRVHICCLASSTRGAQPWVTPLFFNYGSDFRIVWESEKTARHSQIIESNPSVAIVVFDFETQGQNQGLYFEASAREVDARHLEEAIDIFWHGPHEKHDRKPLTASDYRGDKPLRLYEATVREAYSLVETQAEDGHTVERRKVLILR